MGVDTRFRWPEARPMGMPGGAPMPERMSGSSAVGRRPTVRRPRGAHPLTRS